MAQPSPCWHCRAAPASHTRLCSGCCCAASEGLEVAVEINRAQINTTSVSCLSPAEFPGEEVKQSRAQEEMQEVRAGMSPHHAQPAPLSIAWVGGQGSAKGKMRLLCTPKCSGSSSSGWFWSPDIHFSPKSGRGAGAHCCHVLPCLWQCQSWQHPPGILGDK